MKNTLALITVCAITFALSSNSYAQISVGGGLAYGTDIEELGIQATGTYDLNENMRLAADFLYWLTEDYESSDLDINTTAFELNGNFHFIFYDENDIEFYGIGSLGIHYVKAEVDVPGFGSGSDSDTELGLGIGAGAQATLGNVALFVEPRFFVSGFNQLNLGFGARFGIN